ncbi:MAG: hypothetical protein L0027_03435, partial [Candidatus Rokubacteria bacterium]|nr:hypothetical protein [Candidatus Rokubacteria bacterium]
GFAVHHATADPIEEAALDALVRRGSFAEICERCGDDHEAAALLVRWLEDGILGAALRPDRRAPPTLVSPGS